MSWACGGPKSRKPLHLYVSLSAALRGLRFNGIRLGPTNPPEEAQVRWFIRTAFAQTEMLLEMLGLTETLKRVQKIEEEAKKNYAEYGYFEDLFLKWAEELRTFLDVIEAQPQVSIIGISEIAQVLKSVPSGLQHWTWETKARVKGGEARKWHIDHDYHVQNSAVVSVISDAAGCPKRSKPSPGW